MQEKSWTSPQGNQLCYHMCPCMWSSPNARKVMDYSIGKSVVLSQVAMYVYIRTMSIEMPIHILQAYISRFCVYGNWLCYGLVHDFSCIRTDPYQVQNGWCVKVVLVLVADWDSP